MRLLRLWLFPVPVTGSFHREGSDRPQSINRELRPTCWESLSEVPNASNKGHCFRPIPANNWEPLTYPRVFRSPFIRSWVIVLVFARQRFLLFSVIYHGCCAIYKATFAARENRLLFQNQSLSWWFLTVGRYISTDKCACPAFSNNRKV